jgi:AcrR family transcriptional regulator
MIDISSLNMNKPARRYSMERRSANAEATKARVREVAAALYAEQPQHFALKTVAARAGTSVQTILRIYGSKAALVESLLEAGRTRTGRSSTLPDQLVDAIRARYTEYEKNGDGPNGHAADGRRDPTVAKQLEAGRQSHRAWVEQVFAARLGTQASLAEQARLFGLIIATDISVWKQLRRDFGLYRRAAEAVVIGIITALLQER